MEKSICSGGSFCISSPDGVDNGGNALGRLVRQGIEQLLFVFIIAVERTKG